MVQPEKIDGPPEMDLVNGSSVDLLEGELVVTCRANTSRLEAICQKYSNARLCRFKLGFKIDSNTNPVETSVEWDVFASTSQPSRFSANDNETAYELLEYEKGTRVQFTIGKLHRQSQETCFCFREYSYLDGQTKSTEKQLSVYGIDFSLTDFNVCSLLLNFSPQLSND